MQLRYFVSFTMTALENPESLLQAPVTTPVTRMDEVEAARHPVLKYEFES